MMMSVLSQANLVKVNQAELALLSGTDNLEAGSHALLQHGLDLCVVTLGPEGSFFNTAAGSRRVPGFSVRTVDAIGCGDAFVAGLLTQLIAGGNWRDKLSTAQLNHILRYANAVGALTATRQGVIPVLPTSQEVAEFLEKNQS